jgi:YrbI family 3-deoxy-D-manno-octulosonate 8-phosphate phosphatase
LNKEEVAFVGDDLNDLAVFQNLIYPFCPADAHPLVKRKARFVLRRRGGDGAILEVARIILWEREEWEESISVWC